MAVFRSMNEYGKYIVDTKAKRCLALCHGHYHSTKKISRIRGNCYWYMVDINITCGPDYVCDVSDVEGMSYIPDHSFDVIMSVYFPIGLQPQKYTAMLKLIKRILKPDGKIYLTESNIIFRCFATSDEILALERDIIYTIGESAWNEFLATVDNDKQEAIKVMLRHQYTGHNQYPLDLFFDDVKLKFAKKYLQALDYSVKEANGFLILQPV